MLDECTEESASCVDFLAMIDSYIIDYLHQAKENEWIGTVITEAAMIDHFHHLTRCMSPLLTHILFFYISLDKAAFKFFIKWVHVYTDDQIFYHCLCDLRLLEINFPTR